MQNYTWIISHRSKFSFFSFILMKFNEVLNKNIHIWLRLVHTYSTAFSLKIEGCNLVFMNIDGCTCTGCTRCNSGLGRYVFFTVFWPPTFLRLCFSKYFIDHLHYQSFHQLYFTVHQPTLNASRIYYWNSYLTFWCIEKWKCGTGKWSLFLKNIFNIKKIYLWTELILL